MEVLEIETFEEIKMDELLVIWHTDILSSNGYRNYLIMAASRPLTLQDRFMVGSARNEQEALKRVKKDFIENKLLPLEEALSRLGIYLEN